MAKVEDFMDSPMGCSASVAMRNGSAHIRVVQTSVKKKNSKWGIMGPKLYIRPDIHALDKTGNHSPWSL